MLYKGGSTSGTLHCCPASDNPFLRGAIVDSRLLPPGKHRLPFHHGGKVLQLLPSKMRGQTLGDIRHSFGWKGRRRQPAFGEGGGKGGAYFTQRYAGGSGLNSLNLDFLPIQNIEETDFDTVVGGIVGAVPGEDRKNDQL